MYTHADQESIKRASQISRDGHRKDIKISGSNSPVRFIFCASVGFCMGFSIYLIGFRIKFPHSFVALRESHRAAGILRAIVALRIFVVDNLWPPARQAEVVLTGMNCNRMGRCFQSFLNICSVSVCCS